MTLHDGMTHETTSQKKRTPPAGLATCTCNKLKLQPGNLARSRLTHDRTQRVHRPRACPHLIHNPTTTTTLLQLQPSTLTLTHNRTHTVCTTIPRTPPSSIIHQPPSHHLRTCGHTPYHTHTGTGHRQTAQVKRAAHRHRHSCTVYCDWTWMGTPCPCWAWARDMERCTSMHITRTHLAILITTLSLS